MSFYRWQNQKQFCTIYLFKKHTVLHTLFTCTNRTHTHTHTNEILLGNLFLLILLVHLVHLVHKHIKMISDFFVEQNSRCCRTTTSALTDGGGVCSNNHST